MAVNTNLPQNVKNAIGELILYALAQGTDVDTGAWVAMENITQGEPGVGIALGNWKITIQRTAKP